MTHSKGNTNKSRKNNIKSIINAVETVLKLV